MVRDVQLVLHEDAMGSAKGDIHKTVNLDEFFPTGHESLRIRRGILALVEKIALLLETQPPLVREAAISFVERPRHFLPRALSLNRAVCQAVQAGVNAGDIVHTNSVHDHTIGRYAERICAMHVVGAGATLARRTAPRKVTLAGLRKSLLPFAQIVKWAILNSWRGCYRSQRHSTGNILSVGAPGHLRHLSALAPSLQRRGFGVLYISPTTRSALAPEPGGVLASPIPVSLAWLRPSDVPRWQAAMASYWRCRREVHRILRSDRLLEGFDPSARAITSEYLPTAFDTEVARYATEKLAWRRIFSRYPVSGVVLSQDQFTSERALAMLSRARGVPSWVLQHGLATNPDGKGFAPLCADQFFAFGEGSKDALVNMGIPRDRVVVVGRPIYDEVNWGGFPSPTEKRVLFAGQPLYHENLTSYALYKDAIRAVAELPQKLPGYCVTLRPHPREMSHAYADMADMPGVTIDDRSRTFLELLQKCAVVVTCYSTAGVEAYLAGRPVVVWDPCDLPEAQSFATQLELQRAHSRGDLVEAIRNSSHPAAAAPRCCVADGGACARIAERICATLGVETRAGRRSVRQSARQRQK